MSLLFVMLFSVYFAHFHRWLIAAVVAIDVFLKSFLIVSTHCQCHDRSDTGFQQDSLNANSDSDSLIECTFLQNPDLDLLCVRIHIRLIECPRVL